MLMLLVIVAERNVAEIVETAVITLDLDRP